MMFSPIAPNQQKFRSPAFGMTKIKAAAYDCNNHKDDFAKRYLTVAYHALDDTDQFIPQKVTEEDLQFVLRFESKNPDQSKEHEEAAAKIIKAEYNEIRPKYSQPLYFDTNIEVLNEGDDMKHLKNLKAKLKTIGDNFVPFVYTKQPNELAGITR